MKKSVKLLSILLIICMLLSSCAQGFGGVADANGANGNNKGVISDSQSGAEQLSSANKNPTVPEKGTYNEGVVLVKYDGELTTSLLSQLDFLSAEPLYDGSSWYVVTLGESMETVEAVEYLTELDCFEKVDYDYIMGVTADVTSVDVSSNPNYASQSNHKPHKIPEGWEEVKKNGKHPGGSPDVIVAVIDTGVDYNHLDLRNNIWINSAEIPDNGIDDDGNGYIDDVRGWDCVGDDNDPMDDNGHGTHVAGIVAAENNKIGGVGVAYNCKVMVLKAGNSSGYFNNSDIAEAIQYAYMNGASVINMSFGGSNISFAVQEALENAYNTCVLVAAAGNNGLCNQRGCWEHSNAMAFYPAALPYVIGVMSTNGNGSAISGFSNFDHYPYNSVEYEVFAVGEAVPSCWPGNKYATLNGTSMAAPTVAGIAALLRSTYPDRETYSTKYLQSQIVNTGDVLAWEKSVANVYDALTKLPTPKVNLYDYSIDDSTSISANNNGNGVIDAGETVRLSVALQNRGGVATNVNVSIDTMRNNDPSLTDPYFTFVKSTMQLSDIGTYSVRECYEDQYFEIIVSSDCPNDYLVDFNIRFYYENGMDEDDDTIYSGGGVAQFNVSRGYHLPSIISEDTVFTADKLYIVGDDVTIPAGVTVTFEEGCEIQFYDDREYYNSPKITVYGTLNFNGTKERRINIAPNEHHGDFVCEIKIEVSGRISINYVDCINVGVRDDNYIRGWNLGWDISVSSAYNSSFACDDFGDGWLSKYDSSIIKIDRPAYEIGIVQNCYFDNLVSYLHAGVIDSCYIVQSAGSITIESEPNYNYGAVSIPGKFTNNIVCTINGAASASGEKRIDCARCEEVKNNVFFALDDSDLVSLSKFHFSCIPEDNKFSVAYQKYAAQIIENYINSSGNPTVDVYGSLADASLLWPNVLSVEMFDKDGNPITTVGREEIKVRVTFNRPMDKDAGTFLTFGTIEPYADYRIDGEYISDTVWEGTYTLKAQIENGQNFLKVNQAWAAEDQTKMVFGEYQLHEFTIDTTAAMSMNLQAVAKENGIELIFAQDDYDTLLGYNIYRSTKKDGNYVKLNPAILLPTDEIFLDKNAEPSKTYWYTYTVVLTDFTESNPAGKVVATAMDTISPNMYHTPVNQGYENNNLVISCTASDNVAISTVTLYYRAVGAAEWETLNMSKQSDKYSATIFGSEVTLAGLEYYIVATDGRNTINKGSADVPYTVIVKDAMSLSRIGDVDGNGTVTAKDALMLIQCLDGKLILSDDEFKRADLNGDGVLSAAEALRILQYVNGKVNTLEM